MKITAQRSDPDPAPEPRTSKNPKTVRYLERGKVIAVQALNRAVLYRLRVY